MVRGRGSIIVKVMCAHPSCLHPVPPEHLSIRQRVTKSSTPISPELTQGKHPISLSQRIEGSIV